jgi:hypothetical protein
MMDRQSAPVFRTRNSDLAHLGSTHAPLLGELIKVLKPHARGLRRWSVMRAMRDNRLRQSRDIPQKFEDDVERVFRRFCAEDAQTRICAAESAPFYRPRESAGEVWALHPERAEALLSAATSREA